jgi:uncharacterized membrane protein YeaQ/YmgE (transglycosylase-associated protein family)
MQITLVELLIWLIIAAVVGFLGEKIAHRRGRGSLLGAILVGWLAIFLVVGVFHVHITGEPFLAGVPLITSILVAALLVLLWSFFASGRVSSYYDRHYVRGHYRRSPRRFLP